MARRPKDDPVPPTNTDHLKAERIGVVSGKSLPLTDKERADLEKRNGKVKE